MLFKQAAPDIVALQGIDGPSFWSGNFNHLEYLAGHSLFTRSNQASHVEAIGLSHGTALMSRQEMSNPQTVTLDPSLTRVPTGFLPARSPATGSVHLQNPDFIIQNKKQSF
jgi:hypothetical protein